MTPIGRPGSRWRLAGRLFVGAAMLGYPPLVWLGLSRGSPRQVALVLLGLLLPAVAIRLRGSPRGSFRALALLPLVTAAALVAAAALDSSGFVLLTPVAINVVLLIGFGSTLRRRDGAGRAVQPMIERFARLQEPDLSAAKVAWCRRWTVVWCAFFALNAATALLLALLAPIAVWAFYNGLLAYVLMGMLFAGEFVLRRRRFGAPARASASSEADGAASPVTPPAPSSHASTLDAEAGDGEHPRGAERPLVADDPADR